MKVSFDFDDTLDNVHVQKFAKELINMNIDVHVVTCNFNCKYVYDTTDILGIKRENVHCIGYKLKYTYFLEHNDFSFHLDNDIYEIREINKLTKVKGIHYDQNWKRNCLKSIKYEKFDKLV